MLDLEGGEGEVGGLRAENLTWAIKSTWDAIASMALIYDGREEEGGRPVEPEVPVEPEGPPGVGLAG